jgi:hypothetical protein
MTYLPALVIALITMCMVSAVTAQVPSVPGERVRVEQGPPPDVTGAGEVFLPPPLRWEYWCTCKCGERYHRMDVPTPSCEDLNTRECVLDGRKQLLEDCARRLTPRHDRFFPR